LEEPLRRSHELRSLNFLHGMPQVSSRTCCAAAFFVKIGRIGRGVKQPQVETENSTYACFYWISSTIGQSQSDAMRVKTAVVHRAINLAQLCVRCAHVISNCPNRHNFATGHSAFSPMRHRTITETPAKGQKTCQESKPVRRLPKS
jgi:hypothetical protein